MIKIKIFNPLAGKNRISFQGFVAMKDMLRDYMKFREFECAKYDEILKRASVIKGSSFPKNSKAYALNKKK